ncbi:MAG: HDOD domain-containing protein [Deltaproteobacteria bacterium]|nr:HDOD domain-containing protein [Deltaproteobacteria bacterium]
MADKIDAKTIRSKVEQINTLPTVPGTLKRISRTLEKPRISLDELGKIISNDPALTTKILKMVNSASYGFPGRISSVSHATMLLGLNVIKGLLLGVSVFELMEKTMTGLWEHSMACAMASRIIAQKKGLKEPEEVSVCGLLHDIGKTILMLQYSEIFQKAMQEAENNGITIYESESRHFSATHAEAGQWLLQKWHFPPTLVDTIQYHHQPTLSKNSPMETAIVHVADVLVRAKGLGFAGDHVVPELNSAAWDMVSLSEDDIMEILSDLEDGAQAAREET